jgi:hypothetical protein
MKFKILFQMIFYLILKKKIVLACYRFKLKYLNQEDCLFHIEKTQLLFYEYELYVLKDFKFHIKK